MIHWLIPSFPTRAQLSIAQICLLWDCTESLETRTVHLAELQGYFLGLRDFERISDTEFENLMSCIWAFKDKDASAYELYESIAETLRNCRHRKSDKTTKEETE